MIRTFRLKLNFPKKESPKKEAKKIKYFKSQLSCEIFYLKIVFLEHFLSKINGFNEQLQNQTIEISKMKSKLKSCFNSVLEIVCKPMKFEASFPDLVLKDWERSTRRIFGVGSGGRISENF